MRFFGLVLNRDKPDSFKWSLRQSERDRCDSCDACLGSYEHNRIGAEGEVDRLSDEEYAEYRKRLQEQLAEYEKPQIYGLYKARAIAWLSLAKAIIQRLGPKEGTELVRKARWEEGVAAGRRYREAAAERGEPPDVLAVYNGYAKDIPWAVPVWDLELSRNRMVQTIPCHFGKIFRELGELELGKIFCDWDFAVAQTVNPRIRLTRPKFMLDGNPYCMWVWELP